MESHVIKLTPAAQKHGNLNIRPCGRDFFPADVFGGSSREEACGVPITLRVEGLDEPVRTDIPTARVSGRPRWIFRERAWVKAFVSANELLAGDTVTIRRLARRTYELTPNNHKPQPSKQKISTKPYYKTTLGKIYHGDSLTTLEKIAKLASVDLIMTSPPFGLVRKKNYGNVDADKYVEWFKPFGSLLQ
jgi:hypothetical protein